MTLKSGELQPRHGGVCEKLIRNTIPEGKKDEDRL